MAFQLKEHNKTLNKKYNVATERFRLSMGKTHAREENIVFCGGSGSGKSTFFQVLEDGTYCSEKVVASPLYGDWKYGEIKKMIKGNEEESLLTFADSDASNFSYMRMSMNKDGFLLFFAVNSRESFGYIDHALETIYRMNGDQFVPTVLVANKVDLPESERVVSRTEAEAWANEKGCFYTEISAFKTEDVERTIDLLFEAIKKHQDDERMRIEKKAKAKRKLEKRRRRQERCPLL